ncbi:PAS domain-containing protein [Sphingomonas changnyeongensis]|uniref:PAS domain-containing protein n=1 Tax=Sphingomonas changnyeongensis TaxID=2698679 RepID=UPI001E37B334|nr:PAS domain-containing protein [Sphingomonas changnyeongensis]
MAEPGSSLISGAAGIAAAEIIAALPTPLIVLDPDERVREANAAAENLLNIGVATMRGRPLADLIVPPLDYVRRTGSDGALALYDQPLMTTRGLRLRVDFLVGPVLDRPGWRVLVLQQGR